VLAGLGLKFSYVRFDSLSVPQPSDPQTWPMHLGRRGDVARKRTKDQAPTQGMQGKPRSDINDVASLAKVSRQTVSNVL
jgi:Bacterial regulatory proteins, lacI family